MEAKNQVDFDPGLDATISNVDWKAIQAAFAAPFADEEVGQVPIDKSGKLLGRYITARSVMERLDEVIGPGNWSDDYEIWDQEACSVKCTIWVRGVKRSDVGYPNDPSDADNARREPLKAACSDALKRAAVHWGIGRYLYPKPGERGVTPDSALRTTRPASEKQVRFLRDLAGNYNVTLPGNGILEGLPMDVARKWIDELQANGPNADLKWWGGSPDESRDAEDALAASEPADESALKSLRGRVAGADRDMTLPEKTASTNQLAAIAKLSRLLGRSDDVPESMTASEASERITDLSREYNERRPASFRQSA